VEVEPDDIGQLGSGAEINGQIAEARRELGLQALERRVVEEQLSVGNVLIIVQPRIVDMVDPNHRHMQISVDRLGRLALIAGLAPGTFDSCGRPDGRRASSFMQLINCRSRSRAISSSRPSAGS